MPWHSQEHPLLVWAGGAFKGQIGTYNVSNPDGRATHFTAGKMHCDAWVGHTFAIRIRASVSPPSRPPQGMTAIPASYCTAKLEENLAFCMDGARAMRLRFAREGLVPLRGCPGLRPAAATTRVVGPSSGIAWVRVRLTSDPVRVQKMRRRVCVVNHEAPRLSRAPIGG